MAVARTASLDQRSGILRRLQARNRAVDVLRLLVPAAGIVAFALLAGQIYLSNLMRDYGVSGIRIDRGTVIVETPQYSGTSADGARYVVSADEARTPIDRPQEITMSAATLEYVPAGGGRLFASVVEATLDSGAQLVTIPGRVDIVDDEGLEATADGVTADMASGLITARGNVDAMFADGTTISGTSMIRDGAAGTWTFTDATVVIGSLPEAEAP